VGWITNRPLPEARPTLCPACCKHCAPCCYPPPYTFLLYPGCCSGNPCGAGKVAPVGGAPAGTLAPGCPSCGH
jgi:hypothetical protein